MVREAIADRSALAKLRAMTAAEGGDPRYIDEPDRFPKAAHIAPVTSPVSGYLSHIDTAAVGRVSVTLGAGREIVDAPVNHSAGIVLRYKTGDYVQKGDPVAFLHTNDPDTLAQAEKAYLAALHFSEAKPEPAPLIYASVDKDGLHPFMDKPI